MNPLWIFASSLLLLIHCTQATEYHFNYSTDYSPPTDEAVRRYNIPPVESANYPSRYNPSYPDNYPSNNGNNGIYSINNSPRYYPGDNVRYNPNGNSRYNPGNIDRSYPVDNSRYYPNDNDRYGNPGVNPGNSVRFNNGYYPAPTYVDQPGDYRFIPNDNSGNSGSVIRFTNNSSRYPIYPNRPVNNGNFYPGNPNVNYPNTYPNRPSVSGTNYPSSSNNNNGNVYPSLPNNNPSVGGNSIFYPSVSNGNNYPNYPNNPNNRPFANNGNSFPNNPDRGSATYLNNTGNGNMPRPSLNRPNNTRNNTTNVRNNTNIENGRVTFTNHGSNGTTIGSNKPVNGTNSTTGTVTTIVNPNEAIIDKYFPNNNVQPTNPNRLYPDLTAVNPQPNNPRGTDDDLPAADPNEIPKPGSCPPPSPVTICSRTCVVDSHCEGIGKCCKTSCGGSICTRPVTSRPTEQQDKPGSCPAKPTGPWVCTSTCAQDTDCRGRQKCCKNRCGAYACQKPEA